MLDASGNLSSVQMALSPLSVDCAYEHLRSSVARRKPHQVAAAPLLPSSPEAAAVLEIGVTCLTLFDEAKSRQNDNACTARSR